jgi:hypothetical protein
MTTASQRLPGKWGTPVIPALGRLRQEDGELQARLGCTGRPCVKQNGARELVEWLKW